eukprot:gnl/MRDRNA2_/MRDRNA2_74589_c0_seq1.p1 gnl/MRDRNA2_/MRDRNA2_74589_c0~~gnl/MRDRNA2_/MRDRNA2_74589_c0_seq1.p1  ORF type:complete len:258 (+),score=57.13 gnl/MRDRNA2_/MRDRNA2_74589_c0_seq1:26-799(+)
MFNYKAAPYDCKGMASSASQVSEKEVDNRSIAEKIESYCITDKGILMAQQMKNSNGTRDKLLSLRVHSRRTTRSAGIAGLDIAWVKDDDVFLILAARPLAKGVEVLHTYGDHPGKWLLYDYGFVPERNPFDFVTVDIEDLVKACAAEFGERTVRINLRSFRADGGTLPEYVELDSCGNGMSHVEQVLHAICRGQEEDTQPHLSLREQSAFTAALQARDALYGREGDYLMDRQRAADAEAEGRTHAALALRLTRDLRS